MGVKESLGTEVVVLIFTSLATLISGIFLQNIETKLYAIPLIFILLPLINDLNGNFSSILNTKITSKLYLGLLNSKSQIKEERKFDLTLVFIAIFIGIYATLLAYLFSKLVGLTISPLVLIKLLLITLLTILIVLTITFFISLSFALFLFREGRDPDDYLIPFSTFFADFISIIIFSLLIYFFF